MKGYLPQALTAMVVLLGGFICLSDAQTTSSERPDTQGSASSGVACYFVGRAYLNTTGQGQVVGYFTNIKGISRSLFNGSPSEASAFFTFRSDVFSVTPLPANGDVGLVLVSAGSFSIYYNPNPNGNWSSPDTFSSGQLVAKFTRDETLLAQIGSTSQHVLTETLVSSQNFTFGNRTLNFSNITPGGVTLTEFISNTPLPGVSGFPLGEAFAGNGVAVERTD